MTWSTFHRLMNIAVVVSILAAVVTLAGLWPSLGLVASILAFAGWSTFVFLYFRRTGGRWKRTPEGRQLMGSKAVFAAIMLSAFVSRAVGGYPGHKQVGSVLLTLAAWYAWGWVRLLLIQTPSEKRLMKMAGVGDPVETKPPVETKVKAASAAATITGAALWALQRYVFKTEVPEPVALLVVLAVSAGLPFAAGYLAKHTRRPDLPASQR